MQQAAFEALSPEKRQSLEAHLAECPACAAEQSLMLDVLEQLRPKADVAVPRHFFVSEPQMQLTPWSVFQQMSLTWRIATALVVLALGALGGMTVARIHVKAEGRSITLSFGKPVEARRDIAPALANVESLKMDIVQELEEKSREEHLLWVREMKTELARSGQRWNRQQQKSLESALAGLAASVDDRMISRNLSLQANWRQSLIDLYGTIQIQRRRDLQATQNGIDRVATQGEVRNNETEAMLATFLQAADYRIK
jgi:hypothetical protein